MKPYIFRIFSVSNLTWSKWSVEKKLPTPKQGHRVRGHPPSKILADQLTLFQPEGRLCKPHYHLPPRFSDLPKALLWSIKLIYSLPMFFHFSDTVKSLWLHEYKEMFCDTKIIINIHLKTVVIVCFLCNKTNFILLQTRQDLCK